MAKVVRTSVGGTSFNTGEAWQQFFDGLDCPLITVTNDVSNVYINVEDNVTFKIDTVRKSGARSNYCYVICGDANFSIGYANRPLELTICYSDTFFYMQGKQGGSGSGSAHRWCVSYEKFPDFSVYSYISGGLASSFPFITLDSNIYITKLIGYTANTYDEQYNYKSKINTNTSDSTIHYVDGCILMSGTTAIEYSSNFISCSSVEADKKITFNNKNYYSVASNILVSMDN